MTSGQRANRTGRRLERTISEYLEDAGYREVQPAALFWAMRELGQSIYAQQLETGRDLYGKVRRVDFVCYHPRKWPQCLVIQAKWQAARGSVEEKYPFEVLSVQQNEYPTIIVLDGGGYSPGAETWLRSRAGKNQLKHVFDIGEFQRYSAQGSL